jgi:hypothetical protein
MEMVKQEKMTISSSRTIPMNSSHRIWLKLLKIPV